ncbi:MAG: hypoxanthine phosphoribosyltransferase [Lachnospiraceae bacterium]|nr:hypoxanthine phosphoribosyltransferase [Lachnospiraceae bacterium]
MSEKNYEIEVLYSEEELEARISELGRQISEAYRGRSIHMICILKGGVFFMTELSKHIDESIPVTMDFMSVSSYGNDLQSSGVVKIIKDLDQSIAGRDVLVVEDIIDSGRTLHYLLHMLKDRQPASLALCTLLDKPSRREKEVKVDYTGFEIEDLFVLGYGLDYEQKYRNLPYIGAVKFI